MKTKTHGEQSESHLHMSDIQPLRCARQQMSVNVQSPRSKVQGSRVLNPVAAMPSEACARGFRSTRMSVGRSPRGRPGRGEKFFARTVDPACVRFAREAEGRVAGAAFLGVPFLCRQRKGTKKAFPVRTAHPTSYKLARTMVDTLCESTPNYACPRDTT